MQPLQTAHNQMPSFQSSPAPKGVWFPQGFANIFHAVQDIRSADPEHRFKLICSHPHPQFVGRVAADVELTEPESNVQFIAFAKKVIAEHNVKLIIPSRRQALFNRHQSVWKRLGVTVLTAADTKTLKRIDNKVALYSRLAGRNLCSIPAFTEFRTLEEFDIAYAALKCQAQTLCIKPAYGVYGSGFRVLKDTPDTVADLLKESLSLSVGSLRSRLQQDAAPSFLMMQYLDGDERSVDCLAASGELLAAVTRRKSTSAISGQVIEKNPALEEQVRGLVKYLGLNGLFNVQFKDHKGVPFLLEINSRMAGRSFYATVAGVNLPYLACLHFIENKDVQSLATQAQVGLNIGNVSHAIVVPPRDAARSWNQRESQ
ncbi:ATP-grasp domain-containing protein [Nostoc sp. CHAB 5834]|nr:ATP-grasp domain-containing protein [Nostoc sp. CHAB 5834]